MQKGIGSRKTMLASRKVYLECREARSKRLGMAILDGVEIDEREPLSRMTSKPESYEYASATP